MKNDIIISYRVWSPFDNAFDSPNTTSYEKSNKLTYNRIIGRGGIVVELGTGAKDKNGKQIFAGDIIKSSERRNLVVVYDSRVAAFVACIIGETPDEFNSLLFCQDMFPISKVKIIGNIHQNPELINI